MPALANAIALPFLRGGSKPNLITNGTFNTDTSGWTPSNATLSVVAGAMRVTNTGALYGYAEQGITCSIGVSYTLTVTLGGGTSPGSTIAADQNHGGLTASSSTNTLIFTATATTMWISLWAGDNVSGDYQNYDNVVCR